MGVDGGVWSARFSTHGRWDPKMGGGDLDIQPVSHDNCVWTLPSQTQTQSQIPREEQQAEMPVSISTGVLVCLGITVLVFGGVMCTCIFKQASQLLSTFSHCGTSLF